MSKKPPTDVVACFTPDEPFDPSSSGEETFWAWLAKMAKKIGSELLEKALLAFFVFIDPRTPRSARLILGGALAYLLLPLDAIPDFLPGAGFVDDLAAVGAAISAIVDNVRVRHLRRARAQMNEWGIVIDLVPKHWDDDARLHDIDVEGAGPEAA